MSEACFTLEEVAKHNGVGGAKTWMIIKSVVYDLTDYLNEHPGGGELLSEYAGKDGTAAFDDSGHSSDAKNILKAYKIGRLAVRNKVYGDTRKVSGEQRVGIEEERRNRRSFLRIVCGGCV
ncbi:cytochrome b5-like [Venturia canescens]|uniref:cytochrome b5-like n=1 Tax=Venturia canescens TaxID=32260 RepID=UPI001C9CCB45|nr:cytochrome b5-like [Venturia canescens]